MKKWKSNEVSDPYDNIRRDTPPKGGKMKSIKDYNRKNEKYYIWKELDDSEDELSENIQIY